MPSISSNAVSIGDLVGDGGSGGVLASEAWGDFALEHYGIGANCARRWRLRIANFSTERPAEDESVHSGEDNASDASESSDYRRPRKSRVLVELSDKHTWLPHVDNLREWRERLILPGFDDYIEVSAKQWYALQPYIDNIWVKDRDHIEKSGLETTRYVCRFRKQPHWKSDKTKGRGVKRDAKKIERAWCCTVTMKVIAVYGPSDIALDEDGEGLGGGGGQEIVAYRIQRINRDDHSDHCQLDNFDVFRRCGALLTAAGRQVCQGYTPSAVWKALKAEHDPVAHELFNAAGGRWMQKYDVCNSGRAFRKAYRNGKLGGASLVWQQQKEDLFEWCREEGLFCDNISAVRQTDGETTCGVVWATKTGIELLKSHTTIAFMDATHKTNHLGWYLYTIMVKDKYGISRTVAHMLTPTDDGDIVSTFLCKISAWTDGIWVPKFILTDDSAAERRAVRIAFSNRTIHLLCHVHVQRTTQQQRRAPTTRSRFLWSRTPRSGLLDLTESAAAG